LPGQISIFEDGRPAVRVKVDSLKDAPDLDPNLLKPTPEMLAAGEAFALASPSREPSRVDPSDGPTSRFFQPVIVHATVNAEDGSVLDAEALQTSDRVLSRTALEMVKSTAFEPSGFQQEIFVNVRFHFPAVRIGGTPLFHSSVHWVNLDHHGKFPPVRHPPPHRESNVRVIFVTILCDRASSWFAPRLLELPCYGFSC
jgi:hypothetical protein